MLGHLAAVADTDRLVCLVLVSMAAHRSAAVVAQLNMHPPCPPTLQRRLSEIERLEAKAATILDEVAQRTGVGAAAEALWAK